jgi:soluble lytic murein transglycosylase
MELLDQPAQARRHGDRELLAAADLACQREVWDRCINTSERTRRGRRGAALSHAAPRRRGAPRPAIGLDPAYVYGLIRQESRFIMDARSASAPRA